MGRKGRVVSRGEPLLCVGLRNEHEPATYGNVCESDQRRLDELTARGIDYEFGEPKRINKIVRVRGIERGANYMQAHVFEVIVNQERAREVGDFV